MDLVKELFPLSDLNIEFETSNKRKTYRVRWKGLYVEIGNSKFKVKDLSASGVGFWTEDEASFKKGMELTLNLLAGEKTLLKKLKAKVVRIKDGLIGCEFTDLDRRKELLLDKLVLEIQKKELSRKKSKTG